MRPTPARHRDPARPHRGQPIHAGERVHPARADQVEVGIDAEQVAAAIARYNLLALPVVDAEGRMQGIVTVDDALERALGEGWRQRLPAIFEPAEERMTRLALPRPLRLAQRSLRSGSRTSASIARACSPSWG